jgi:hypothetical protein
MTSPDRLIYADMMFCSGLGISMPWPTRSLSEDDIREMGQMHPDLVRGIASSLLALKADRCTFARYAGAAIFDDVDILGSFLERGVEECEGAPPIASADLTTRFKAFYDIAEKTEHALGTRIYDLAMAAVMPAIDALSTAWH